MEEGTDCIGCAGGISSSQETIPRIFPVPEPRMSTHAPRLLVPR